VVCVTPNAAGARGFPRSAADVAADPRFGRPPGTFGEIVEKWLALSYGLNQVNQSSLDIRSRHH
jgi:hypothetical protein